MKNNIFNKLNQGEIIKQLNLIQAYIIDSKEYFNNFESYLNDPELNDQDKLICIKNQYLEFNSNHSILLNKK